MIRGEATYLFCCIMLCCRLKVTADFGPDSRCVPLGIKNRPKHKRNRPSCEAVASEASLTGESAPQMKDALALEERPMGLQSSHGLLMSNGF